MNVVHFDGLFEDHFILIPFDPCGSSPVCKILWNGKESIGAPVEGTPPYGLNVETIIVPMGGSVSSFLIFVIIWRRSGSPVPGLRGPPFR